MEVPEKLYIHESQYWGLMANRHDITKKGIEYIRKDAFIEKMFNFLSEKYLIKTKEPLRWVPIKQVIEDFKKYMEE